MINQSDAVGVKRVAKVIATAVMVFVLAILVFASTAFAGLLGEYNVDIVDNGQTTTITTNESEPIEILAQASITLNGNDKLDLTGFTSGTGGKIVIDRLNTVIIEKDSVINTYNVYADTVGDALKEAGITIGEKNEVNYALDAPVVNGMVVTVKTAFTVALSADGAVAEFNLIEGTVAQLLELAQIELGKDDYTEPSLDASLKTGMKVNVYRVAYQKIEESKAVAYKTTEKKDEALEGNTTKVLQKGVPGQADVTYKVKYINGKESERKELSYIVTKEPVNKIVQVGAENTAISVKSNGVKSKSGYSVGQVISGKYTHYCACATCNGNSRGVTASGKKISNGMDNPYYVACNWLPMGSVIEVSGKNYTVVDRGGSGLSRQGRIDIFTPEGHKTCYRYGTGGCTIKIVRLGW